MPDPVANIARAAADRLAPEFDPGLVMGVEDALANRRDDVADERFFSPIDLGSLVVSAVTLAWTIYHEIRKDHALDPQVIRHELGVKLDATMPDDLPQQRRVIEVIVSELMRQADEGA